MNHGRIVSAVAFAAALVGCNAERAKECEGFLSAIKPLEQGTPSAQVVDDVHKHLDAIKFEDQPLGIYAKNYGERLTALSSTLLTAGGPNPPDGTDQLLASKLKEERTDSADVARYCAQ